MTLKVRSLPNKLISEDKDTILFYLSEFMIDKIKKDRNYFILALKNDHGNVLRHLGYFEIIRVSRNKKEFGGSGGTHKECELKRLGI